MNSSGAADQGKPSDHTGRTEKGDESSLKAQHADAGALSMAFPIMPPTASKTMPEASNISLFHNAILAAGNHNETELDRKALSRKNRLEQNRKAARESRRRKKMMIDELQRSVIFFTRANALLRQQNIELLNRTTEAQRIVTAHEFARLESTAKTEGDRENNSQEDSESPFQSSSMQIGASMKAMANFQEAASAAMQSALKGLAGGKAHQLGEPCDDDAKKPIIALPTVPTEHNHDASRESKGQDNEHGGLDNDPKRTTDSGDVI